MYTGQNQLLRRSPLCAGESLDSLFARLRALNKYESAELLPAVIKDALGPQASRDRYWLPDRAETFNALAQLTGIEPKELYRATAHSFAPVLDPPEGELRTIDLPDLPAAQLMSQTTAQKRLRPRFNAQYCPECLRNESYHRSIWGPVAVSACLEHECLLIDRCPNCGEPLEVQSIVATQCRRCKASLTEVTPVDLHTDDWGLSAQRMIQTWLTEGLSPTNESLLTIAPLSLWYRFLDGLQSAAKLAGPDWAYLHQIPDTTQPDLKNIVNRSRADESYVLFATAAKALTNWPNGFDDYLTAYANRSNNHATGTIRGDLNVIYVTWLQRRWQHEAYEPIQQAVDRYICANYTASSLSRSKIGKKRSLNDMLLYASAAEAAHMLEVTVRTVERLSQAGFIPIHKLPEGRRFSRALVSRDAVIELRERWRDGFSLDQVIKKLGVSDVVGVALARQGSLQVLRSPDLDGCSYWLFDSGSVHQLYEAVVEQNKGNEIDAAAVVPIVTATKMLAWAGLNEANLVEAIRGRKIRVALSGDAGIKDLLLHRDDVQTYGQYIVRQHGWIGRLEAERRLDVDPEVLRKWVKSGLIPLAAKHGTTQQFDEHTIECFKANHVGSAQAADIVGLNRITIEKWARRGRLKAVSGPNVDGCAHYLFERKEVEALNADNRLTAPQLAAKFGVSRCTMSRWISTGKVTPISGPGIDGYEHYLFDASSFSVPA